MKGTFLIACDNKCFNIDFISVHVVSCNRSPKVHLIILIKHSLKVHAYSAIV